MKKNACILICLLLTALLLPAFALETGEYTWQGHTVRLIEVQENPMLAPTDMKDGDRALGLRLEVPEALAADKDLAHALYEAARLTDANGQSYKPGAALAKDNVLTHLFAVPASLDVSALRLSFEGEAAAEDSLKAPADDLNALFGAWSEADARFAMHNGVTWTSAPEDIAALIGETNLQRQEMPDGKVFVLSDKKALVWKGCEIHTLYFFQQEKLACVARGFVHDDDAVYEALCGALAKMYGEPNITDFSRVSACAAPLGASPDNLRGLEAAPWRAWLLPDRNTLVFAADHQEVGILYLNTARLQAQ